MSFQFPATELFRLDGSRRVVWGPEEYADALSEGFTEEKPGPVVEPAPALIVDEPVITEEPASTPHKKGKK